MKNSSNLQLFVETFTVHSLSAPHKRGYIDGFADPVVRLRVTKSWWQGFMEESSILVGPLLVDICLYCTKLL